MPTVTIQLVAENEIEIPRQRVQSLADELGRLFDIGPGETWVRLTHLPGQHYAENDTAPDPAVQPTFVEIIKGALPDQDALAAEAKRVAEIVARQLARPLANTHVIYQPPGIGRVAFGGELVRA